MSVFKYLKEKDWNFSEGGKPIGDAAIEIWLINTLVTDTKKIFTDTDNKKYSRMTDELAESR